MLRLISVIKNEDYFPKLLPSQTRQSRLSDNLFQEATADMVRRDFRKADTLSQLRSDFRLYRLRAEGQSEKFDNLKQNWRNIWNDHTQKAHSSGTCTRRPELRMSVLDQKLLASELEKSQLVTDVSSLRNQETELQGHLQNFDQESTRINARTNQHQSTNNSMITRTKGIDAAVTDGEYPNRSSTS